MMLDERQELLTPIIEAYRYVPFVWAVHDCALFAARCVDAQLGTRFESKIQRDYSYNEPVTAIRIVKGAGGWEKIIGRYLGPSVSADCLEFGDVVLGHGLSPFERTALLGICDEEMFMAPGNDRLEWIPMANAQMGWKLTDIKARLA